MNSDQTRRAFLMTAGAGLLAAAAPATQLAPPDKQPPNLKPPPDPQPRLGWALLGIGTLTLGQVLPAFGQTKRCRATALVSGHPDKAKQTAEAYGVDQSKGIYTYDDFDRIAENKDVQVVYNCLPDHLHAEFTIRAAKAGKHVLVEKPMARSVKECEQMIAACREAKVKLMVAYRLRYEPFNRTAIEMLRKKELGEIKLIDASNVQNVSAPNIRLSKETGTGPIGDVGVYCINACRYLSGEEPAEVTAFAHQPTDDPRFADFPESYVFTLRFPSGVLAHCGCSFGGRNSKRYRVECADGWLDLDPAYTYSGQELHVGRGRERANVELTEVNHFAAMMDHFSECVQENKDPLTPGEDGLNDLKVIEAVNESVRTGKPVKVG